MGGNDTDQPAKRRTAHRVGQKMRTAENSARGDGCGCSNEDPTSFWKPDGEDGGDRHSRRGVSGWKRIPSTAAEGREIKRTGVDELRPWSTDHMLDKVAQYRDNSMSHQSLPPGELHVRSFQLRPDEQHEQAERDQGLASAEPIADIAEIREPGVREIPDGVIQRPNKLRQWDIEFKQAHEGQRDGRT